MALDSVLPDFRKKAFPPNHVVRLHEVEKTRVGGLEISVERFLVLLNNYPNIPILISTNFHHVNKINPRNLINSLR